MFIALATFSMASSLMASISNPFALYNLGAKRVSTRGVVYGAKRVSTRG